MLGKEQNNLSIRLYPLLNRRLLKEIKGSDSMYRKHAIHVVIVRCLALTLIGWFAYALARALWTIVYLGAPLYDWQWYPAIIAWLIVLVVRVLWRLPRSRLTTLVLIGLFAWTVAGYNGFGRVAQVSPANAPPIPISFWAFGGILQAPETVLEDLHSAGGWLYLSIGDLEGENGRTKIAGLQRLAKHGIGVYLMPPASDFLSVPVHDEWIANAQKMADTVQNVGLTNVRGIIGDVEHPRHTSLDVLAVDQDDLFQTVRDLDGLIQLMKGEYPNLELGVTALWPLYMDNLDGDLDLSIIHRSTVDPPGSWDYINVMTYSSYFPPSWRAYYVYLIERAMAQRYPEHQPSHLIGLVGGGFPGEPLLDFDDIVRDARLSRAMGVREIVVFQLDGALEVFGDDFIRRFTAAVNDVQSDSTVKVTFSRPASALLYGVVAADALLDVRSWKGLLLIAWMALSGLVVYRSVRCLRLG